MARLTMVFKLCLTTGTFDSDASAAAAAAPPGGFAIARGASVPASSSSSVEKPKVNGTEAIDRPKEEKLRRKEKALEKAPGSQAGGKSYESGGSDYS